MEIEEIRDFRRDLRSFSQILDRQVGVCCCSEVTPAQCHVILALEESGPVSNGDLAGLLHVDASTLSRAVNHLFLKDLVKRNPHPSDRRTVLLDLSERGRGIAAEIHASADGLYQEVLKEIPADQREDVLREFSLLVQAFRKWRTTECDANREI